MLTLIVARAAKGAIGKDGQIPWHAPEDLALFSRETTGGVIIMGRKTWDSLPFRPLPRRQNIVVTSRPMAADGAVFLPFDAAMAHARALPNARLYGIGGAGIYAALLPLADRLLITEMDVTVDGADTFFPDFDENQWRETLRLPLRDAPPRATLRELIRR
ncbi:MAG: dihydrofolate reductase [Cypionkella sp.]|nr:dihydrofolate reductase [Cypionkella sp.]